MKNLQNSQTKSTKQELLFLNSKFDIPCSLLDIQKNKIPCKTHKSCKQYTQNKHCYIFKF